MKVILDTNVIVSALLTPSGLSAKILNLILNGSITIVYDNKIMIEYVEILNRKQLKINKLHVDLVINYISMEGEFRIANPLNVIFIDEDDKMFYELFKTGRIDYLITGNIKHFPKEKKIVTPREFLERI